MLKEDLVREFVEKRNYKSYWDEIALLNYPEKYKLRIYEVNKGDIEKFHSVYELSEEDIRLNMERDF